MKENFEKISGSHNLFFKKFLNKYPKCLMFMVPSPQKFPILQRHGA